MAKARMYNSAAGSSFPVIFISKKLAETILNTTITENTLHKTYKANISISINKITNNLQSTDVIGILPGTDKNPNMCLLQATIIILAKVIR